MAFPAVALVDSFKRANENPLSNGGKWTLLAGSVSRGRVVEEAYSAVTAFSEGEDNAYWNVGEYDSPAVAAEVHADLASNKRYLSLWACLSSPGTGERSGYRLRAERTGLNKYTLIAERMDKGAFTVRGEFLGVTLKAGDSFALQVANGVLTVWKKTGAGAWTFLYEVADATYTTGYVGIGAKGNVGQLRNLEVGVTHEHTFKLSQPSSPSRSLAVSRSLTASQGQAASGARALARSLACASASSGRLASAPARTLPAALSSSSSLTSQPALHLSPAQSSASLVGRAVALTLGVAQGQAAQLADQVQAASPVELGVASSSVEPKALVESLVV